MVPFLLIYVMNTGIPSEHVLRNTHILNRQKKINETFCLFEAWAIKEHSRSKLQQWVGPAHEKASVSKSFPYIRMTHPLGRAELHLIHFHQSITRPSAPTLTVFIIILDGSIFFSFWKSYKQELDKNINMGKTLWNFTTEVECQGRTRYIFRASEPLTCDIRWP